MLGLMPNGEKYALLFGVWAGDHRAHPVHRAVARRAPAGAVRARAGPDLCVVGRAPLPRHPAARGARRRAEGDGPLAAPPSAARDLRPARGRRDLRLPRDHRRAAASRRRPRRVGVLQRAHRARALAESTRRSRRSASSRRAEAACREAPPAPAPDDRRRTLSTVQLFPDIRLRRFRRSSGAARPRARDAALARPVRHAALRRARAARERGAAGHVALDGGGSRARGRRSSSAAASRPSCSSGSRPRRTSRRPERGRTMGSSSRRSERCGRVSPSSCCSPTSASASTRRTATAAWSSTATSTTTRPSSCSRARRSATSRPAPTSSRRAT